MGYNFHWAMPASDWMLLAAGAGRTCLYSIAGLAFGLAFGLACALGRRSRHVLPRLLAGAYVEAIRNTPLLVQIFLVFFGLPSLGVKLSAGAAAILALSLNFAAYSGEIVRGGIEAIPRGQIEAAESLGLSRWEVFAHVVILPALEKTWPSLVSQFVLMMLGSSIVSAIGADELTSAANTIQSRTFRPFEVYGWTTLIYLGLTIAFSVALWALAQGLFRRRRIVGLTLGVR
ncbi:MAG: amino acid ABC transporter permease [Acetobacteraceae bacterium]